MVERICLGIESTSHTFGVGIANNGGNILANEKDVFTPPKGSGIEPSKAARHHREIAEKVLENALKTANTKISDVDLISVAAGPGLAPCLLAGMEFAKKLATNNDKPLIPVNHAIAHIEIGKLTTNAKDPVCLYISGGNTQIVSLANKRYRVLGETLDIPIGNAQDFFARKTGLQFPGGPKLDEIAKRGRWTDLPYVVKGMDVSFTGIVTAALKKIKTEKMEDVIFSLNEVMYSMLTEVTERALAHAGKNEILLIGGVASSQRFREMMAVMCEERGAKCFSVPKEYAGDCGANIAWTGLLFEKIRTNKIGSVDIKPKWRVDEVEITY
ncbi:MAG: N(6)-L-threonylcarbamoyladenine synthase Kae1 [Candidatus Aenigmarchaeota archaeon]|nr:N(6)-L-threonylcarbamoyladenine synthase Kae1 [Candidatus Aenigmarchaeota archaeon]